MGVYASPGEVPLGILGGSVPRGRPVIGILNLFQTKKCLFSHVLRPSLKEIMSTLLRLEQ